MIYREKTIQINVTPREAAEVFCEMDSMQQAEFFNCIASEVKSWRGGISQQLQSISDEQMLTKEAREVMCKIGEYSAPF